MEDIQAQWMLVEGHLDRQPSLGNNDLAGEFDELDELDKLDEIVDELDEIVNETDEMETESQPERQCSPNVPTELERLEKVTEDVMTAIRSGGIVDWVSGHDCEMGRNCGAEEPA